MIRSILALSCFLLVAASAGAGMVEFSDTIGVDTTWTAQDTIHIVDRVVVLGGAELRIEPGTHIVVDNGKDIWVHGSIRAEGTEQEPITFDYYRDGGSFTPLLDSWGGVRLRYYSTGEFSHCHFSYAQYGIHAIESPLTVYGCRFENVTSSGIRAEAYSTTLQPLTIENSWFEQTDVNYQGRFTGILVYRTIALNVYRTRVLNFAEGVDLYSYKTYFPTFIIEKSEIAHNAQKNLIIRSPESG